MKLGFIGLGIMGESMAENLVKKSGHEVYVFDNNDHKIKHLEVLGAHSCTSGAHVFESADIVFTSVPTAKNVNEVIDNAKDSIREGHIFIDMSTISPEESIAVAKKVSALKGIMLDAPVVKSKAAAIDGTLGIYVGGPEDVYEKVKHLLLHIGNNIVYMGDNGSGVSMKICHNMLVGLIQNGVNEVMTLAGTLGIEPLKFKDAIAIGGGQNMYLDTKAKAIADADYTTAFSIVNMYKDVTIARKIIEDLNLNLPGTKHVWSIYDEAMKADYGTEDFAATYKVVQNRKGK